MCSRTGNLVTALYCACHKMFNCPAATLHQKETCYDDRHYTKLQAQLCCTLKTDHCCTPHIHAALRAALCSHASQNELMQLVQSEPAVNGSFLFGDKSQVCGTISGQLVKDFLGHSLSNCLLCLPVWQSVCLAVWKVPFFLSVTFLFLDFGFKRPALLMKIKLINENIDDACGDVRDSCYNE